MAKKKRNGVGAKSTVFLQYLHLAKTVLDKYPKQSHNDKLEELLVIRQEMKVVNCMEREIVVFCHDTFNNAEYHCVSPWVKVTKESPEAQLFEAAPSIPAVAEPNQDEERGEETAHIPDHVFLFAWSGRRHCIGEWSGLPS